MELEEQEDEEQRERGRDFVRYAVFFGPLQLSDRWLAPRRRTRGRKEPQSLQPKEFVNIHRKHSNINYSQRSKFME